MNSPNTFEALARQHKATRLADLLAAYHISSDRAKDLDAEDWQRIAQRAGVHAPSPQTQALVVSLLAGRERVTAEAAHV